MNTATENTAAPAIATPTTVFLQSQDVFRVSDSMRTVTHKLLPGGVYLLEKNIFGFYLTMKSEQANPDKIYGSVPETAERIINSFKERPGKTTGVLLTGEKGSGKTMLMNNLSSQLAAQGIPTIIINNNYTGDDFNSFISSITQPAMLSFDEFEKVYSESEQNEILTLLSGLFETHKLVVMTVNNEQGVNKHMRNRPGRLFYRIRYNGVEESAIRQYCGDRLKNQAHTDDVVALSENIMGFNFDMLVCLVEEMNRYDEPVAKAIKLMNIDFVAFNSTYDVTLITKDGEMIQASPWSGVISEQTYRVMNLQLLKIDNLAQREKLALELEQYINSTGSQDRSSSELSFVYTDPQAALAAGEIDEDDLEESGGASVNNTERAQGLGLSMKLSASRWQYVDVQILDSQLTENRGKVIRFTTPYGEVVMRRAVVKPNPFGYGAF